MRRGLARAVGGLALLLPGAFGTPALGGTDPFSAASTWTFQILPQGPDGATPPRDVAVSADGSTVFGIVSYRDEFGLYSQHGLYVWRRPEEPVVAPSGDALHACEIGGATADGTAVVGVCSHGPLIWTESRWANGDGPIGLNAHLGFPAVPLGTVRDVSADGTVMGGAIATPLPVPPSDRSGWISLGGGALQTGVAPAGYVPERISGDGAVAVEVVELPGSTHAWIARRISSSPGTVPDASFYGFPFAVSHDGATVVGGEAPFDAAAAQAAWVWRLASGREALGDGIASAVSADGSLVVGVGPDGPFAWDPALGRRDIGAAIAAAGGGAWTIDRVTGMSADGDVIAGEATDAQGARAAWILARTRCGDGLVADGEQCDDGNTTTGDGCSATCRLEIGAVPGCGDGTLGPGEHCDDGNRIAGDGCSATCRPEPLAPPPPGSCLGNPGDTDALVAVRARVAAECPCDRGRRRDYKRCVRSVLSAAVAAGELRATCSSYARRIHSRSACGSKRGRRGAKAPCITHRVDKGRTTCNIRSIASCRSKGARLRFACGYAATCLDALDHDGDLLATPRDAAECAVDPSGLRIGLDASLPTLASYFDSEGFRVTAFGTRDAAGEPTSAAVFLLELPAAAGAELALVDVEGAARDPRIALSDGSSAVIRRSDSGADVVLEVEGQEIVLPVALAPSPAPLARLADAESAPAGAPGSPRGSTVAGTLRAYCNGEPTRLETVLGTYREPGAPANPHPGKADPYLRYLPSPVSGSEPGLYLYGVPIPRPPPSLTAASRWCRAGLGFVGNRCAELYPAGFPSELFAGAWAAQCPGLAVLGPFGPKAVVACEIAAAAYAAGDTFCSALPADPTALCSGAFRAVDGAGLLPTGQEILITLEGYRRNSYGTLDRRWVSGRVGPEGAPSLRLDYEDEMCVDAGAPGDPACQAECDAYHQCIQRRCLDNPRPGVSCASCAFGNCVGPLLPGCSCSGGPECSSS